MTTTESREIPEYWRKWKKVNCVFSKLLFFAELEHPSNGNPDDSVQLHYDGLNMNCQHTEEERAFLPRHCTGGHVHSC